MNTSIQKLQALISEATSPFHAASAAEKLLSAGGFQKLNQADVWDLRRGGAYYTVCFGSEVIAFTVGKNFKPGDALRIAASHLDWPSLRVKPAPEQISGGCCRLNIEPYGGMIFSTWMDRPLSVAGSVSVLTADGKSEARNVDFREPLLTIPSLAIHMNHGVNSGVEIKPNRDLLPLLRAVEDNWNCKGYFVGLLANRLGVKPEEILTYDLCVYNPEEGCLVGAEQNLYSAPRLDNLTSVSACLEGIINGKCESGINVAVLYDHEEVGSTTKQGANGNTLSMILEKIALSLGLDRTAYLDLLMTGTLLSCDVAHAIHPNYPEYADPTCRAFLNRGVVIKMNYNQRYSTDVEGLGAIFALCRKEKIPYQQFMNRADLRGGSTIGAMASANLGMCTVDCGVALLAMHSAREVMGADDQNAMDRFVTAFFAD